MNQPAPVPVHLLASPGLSEWLERVLWAAVVLRWAALPAALWFSGGSVVAFGCLAIAACVILWSRQQSPRSVARPLLEEAALLVGCGCAVASSLPGLDGVVACAVGATSALVGLGLGALLLHATWGWDPHFVQMRRPRFRVLGDNPTSCTFVCRARCDARGLTIVVPPGADGPVTISVTRLSTLSVAGFLSFRELDPVLRDGPAVVRMAPAPSGATLGVAVPPGRYVLAVRYYRPASPQPVPQMRLS